MLTHNENYETKLWYKLELVNTVKLVYLGQHWGLSGDVHSKQTFICS